MAMTGAKTSAHDFSSVHGSTSSGDDFDGIEDSVGLRRPSLAETTTTLVLGGV